MKLFKLAISNLNGNQDLKKDTFRKVTRPCIKGSMDPKYLKMIMLVYKYHIIYDDDFHYN